MKILNKVKLTVVKIRKIIYVLIELLSKEALGFYVKGYDASKKQKIKKNGKTSTSISIKQKILDAILASN